MRRALLLLCAVVCLSAPAFSQCGQMAINPLTHRPDCIGNNTPPTVNTTLPSTANAIPQFGDTLGGLISSNWAQDPAHGSLTPLAGVFMFPVVVSENAGHPVFDCSVANYFIISSVTQADAITLANCAPVNGARPHFGYSITQDGTGHAVTLPAGFSLAAAIDTTANAKTVQWGTWDGTNFTPDASAWDSDTPLVIKGPVRTACATPAAGFVCIWADSTGKNLQVINDAGNKSGTAFTLANASNKWLNSFDATTGLFTQTQPSAGNLSDGSTIKTRTCLTASFDGQGSAIANNTVSPVGEAITGLTVTGYNVHVDTGTITIDVLKATNANGTPTFATITSSQTPAVASGTNFRSTTVNLWTSPSATDLLEAKVTAVSGATKASLVVECTQ